MIILKPPAGDTVPFKKHTFTCSGREVRVSVDAGTVMCLTEDEAGELELEGWTRLNKLGADDRRKAVDADARHSGFAMASAGNRSDAALKLDGEVAAFRHFAKSEPSARRIVIGEVDVGRPIGRVHVEHDQLGDEIVVHGATAHLTDDVDQDLANAFRFATASFLDAAQDAEAQSDVKTIIASLVAAMLGRHRHLADAVTAQKMRVRRA